MVSKYLYQNLCIKIFISKYLYQNSYPIQNTDNFDPRFRACPEISVHSVGDCFNLLDWLRLCCLFHPVEGMIVEGMIIEGMIIVGVMVRIMILVEVMIIVDHGGRL